MAATVTLTMTDEETGKSITRTIDATNAMKSGSYGFELGDEESQRINLQRWCDTRGQKQHETFLTVKSWKIN